MESQAKGDSTGLQRVNMKFQDAAAYLMMKTCPSVSAHLQQEFNEGVIRSKISIPQVRKHQVCERCGTIANAEDTKCARKFIFTTCSGCNQMSKSALETYKRANGNVNTRLNTSILQNNGEISTRSKKKAQRKNKSSLQAMLAQSKASTTPTASFGFGLMDLMKT